MKIREFLTDENKWCKAHLAINIDGNGVNENDFDACKWCLIGAAYHCYGEEKVNEIIGKIQAHLKLSRAEIPTYNDKSEFKDIKELVETLDI